MQISVHAAVLAHTAIYVLFILSLSAMCAAADMVSDMYYSHSSTLLHLPSSFFSPLPIMAKKLKTGLSRGHKISYGNSYSKRAAKSIPLNRTGAQLKQKKMRFTEEIACMSI
jgi:hypothetical protein